MKRIIVADDHSFVRVGLIQILKDEYPQAEIKEVGDGESLVKEVMQQEWDLVISDLDMPGRAKRIRSIGTNQTNKACITGNYFEHLFRRSLCSKSPQSWSCRLPQ